MLPDMLQDPQPSGATSLDEASQTLGEIAQILGAKQARSAEQQLKLIHEQLGGFIKKLPDGFFDPLAPEKSFTNDQVSS